MPDRAHSPIAPLKQDIAALIRSADGDLHLLQAIAKAFQSRFDRAIAHALGRTSFRTDAADD